MVDVIKSFFEGNLPQMNTTAYTVPAGKYAVTKSILVCNNSSTDATVRVTVGSTWIIYNHVIKANATLLIDDLDLPILAGETITIYGSLSTCNLFITGFERDYVSGDYPYSVINVTANSSLASITISFDSVIKSIILSSNTSGVSNVNVYNSVKFISAKEIKAGDTLIIPMAKMFVPKGRNLTYNTVGNSCRITFILEKVGD
ncbi:hypothetical protein N6H13_10400 [Paenibacillus sp. CC-CFT742]|nr:hypothetical protein [Paenibacillus sp. CC-CFT742]WJH30947.1 hypothetical protein N6H13_10400 [Paenibacillus sp. CC-CFT742]